MSIGFGIFCSTSDNRLSTNHTVRLSNLSLEAVLRSFGRNLEDLHRLLDLSRSRGFTIFRLGSSFVPFASHPSFRAEWLEPVERRLREHAAAVRAYGVRITMHPGQYVVLSSPREEVVERSLAELRYHFWVLDALGLGRESVVVVHVGGAYGDKRRAVERFADVVEENGWLRRRLAVENDERYYTVADIVELSEALRLPAVLDFYHHRLNPSDFDVDRLLSTWRGVVPEVHLSSAPEQPRRPGEHGDYVDVRDFEDLVELLGAEASIDIIVEAKKKEKAVEKLVAEIVRTKPHLEKRLVRNTSERW